MGEIVGAHVDAATAEWLEAVATAENRPASQIVAVALRAMLDLSPGAREALYAIDGAAEAAERDFASQLLSRAALKAYDGTLDARRAGESYPMSDAPADTEGIIEGEEV